MMQNEALLSIVFQNLPVGNFRSHSPFLRRCALAFASLLR